MTRRQLVLTAAVFAAFAAFATWRSPVPGVNEPHYLCKAKHFWDSKFCARDAFITSANAHWVFYAAIGPLTRVFPLDQTAWIGRILVWGGLAYGWVRLVGTVLPGTWSPLWSSLIFLAIQAPGSLAGEWLVGGVESKGFAYVALLVSIAAACRSAWRNAGIAAGVAISFHPIVGLWGLAALTGAWFLGQAVSPAHNVADRTGESPGAVPSWRAMFAGGVLCLAFSLPGLIPAVALLVGSPSPAAARLAEEIQVFDRLKHHLDPADFRAVGYALDGVLLVAWLVLRRLGVQTSAGRFFDRFVLATLVIAVLGLGTGLGLRSARLMKFYPFRLSDIFLPMGVAVAAAGWFERLVAMPAEGSGLIRRAFVAAARPGLAALAVAWCISAPGRNENASRWPRDDWVEFVDVCRWIDENTPADALFLTPYRNIGFKWYAQRAEYVTWKDCPQDAAGILEWKKRSDLVANLRPRLERLSGGDLAALRRQTGADYVLAINAEANRRQAVYRNRTFSVILPARE